MKLDRSAAVPGRVSFRDVPCRFVSEEQRAAHIQRSVLLLNSAAEIRRITGERAPRDRVGREHQRHCAAGRTVPSRGVLCEETVLDRQRTAVRLDRAAESVRPGIIDRTFGESRTCEINRSSDFAGDLRADVEVQPVAVCIRSRQADACAGRAGRIFADSGPRIRSAGNVDSGNSGCFVRDDPAVHVHIHQSPGIIHGLRVGVTGQRSTLPHIGNGVIKVFAPRFIIVICADADTAEIGILFQFLFGVDPGLLQLKLVVQIQLHETFLDLLYYHAAVLSLFLRGAQIR